MRPDRRLNQSKDKTAPTLRARKVPAHENRPTVNAAVATADVALNSRRSSDMLLASSWMGGFDGADYTNGSGVALSMTELTQHDSHVDDDYRRLADFGIRT